MDKFTRAYIEAALHYAWEVRDHFGRPIDADRIAPESLDGMKRDAKRFQREQGELLQQAYNVPGYDPETAGHDFWLTRNRAGAGFWDGDLPEDLGEKLTAAAHAYGEQDLYVGDDGKVYATGAERWVNEGSVMRNTTPNPVAKDFDSAEDAMHHAAHGGFTHFTHIGKYVTVYGPGADGRTIRAKLYKHRGKYHFTNPSLTKRPIPSRAHVIEHSHHHDDALPPEAQPDTTSMTKFFVEKGGHVQVRASARVGTREGSYPMPPPDHQIITTGSHRGVVYKVYVDYQERSTYCLLIEGGPHNGGQGWHQEGFSSAEHAVESAKASIDAYPREYGARDVRSMARSSAVDEKGLVWLHRPDGIYWANSRGGTYWLMPTPAGQYQVTWTSTTGDQQDLGMHPLASAYQVAARFDPDAGRIRSRQVAS